jgi:hypothetical protein
LTNATGLPVSGISATGTPSSTTYLRGDGSWATVGAGLTINTTAISGGTTGRILYDNAGTVGELATIPIANGGTNATTAATALSNLGGVSTGKSIAMAIVFGS